MPTCPLCGLGPTGPSWLGSTRFRDVDHTYLRCASCRSLFCDPMPDERSLAAMYGPAYAQMEPDEDAAKDPTWPLAVLRVGTGTFVDYGCGADGTLLVAARAAGWHPVGVELDPDVAAAAAARTGETVLAAGDAFAAGPVADVLNLGDVVEHLTDPLAQLRAICGLVRPGGLVVAQGPLEAQANLFTWVVAGARRLRGRPTRTMPPYHVLLATSAGQRSLFRRAGLVEERFEVREVAWPAPASLADAAWPKGVALLALRRASQLVSRIGRGHLGNRYFYAGRRPGARATGRA